MKFMKKAMAFGIACVMGLTLADAVHRLATIRSQFTLVTHPAEPEKHSKRQMIWRKMLTDAAVTVDSNGDMATKVGADPNGIGYVSLSTDFEANNLTALNYEGVAPSKETVLDGTYGMQRRSLMSLEQAGDFADDRTEQLLRHSSIICATLLKACRW